MYDVITVGEILAEVLAEQVDQVFYQPGKLLGPFPSGAPAIAIDQAARMGARTAILAKVGKDDFGRLNKDRLSANGVDISHILETEDNSTGVAFVTYFADGGRQFLFHFRHAACGELCSADIQEQVIQSARYLHIMGCSITGSPSLGDAIITAVRYAKKHGVKISFDPNIRPELLSGQIMDYYQEILEACDLLLTGKSELKILFGDHEKAVASLLSQKERIVVVKDGARGTQVYSREQAFSVGVYPAQEVDPTGAGDSFDGTFLAMLCHGADLKTAADYGNAAGARAVSKRGPMEGNSFKAEIEAFRAQTGGVAIADITNPYRA